MDEYKEYLYERNSRLRTIDGGDLTEQFAVREKLKCKSFDWFIKEVAPDLMEKYPPVPLPDFASGAIQSDENPSLCIDTLNQKNIGIYACASDKVNPQATQNFALSWQRDIRQKNSEQCWDVSESGKPPITLFGCHGMQGNQLFRYLPISKQIQHVISKRCLDADLEKKEVFVSTCDKNKPNQKWTFGFVNATAVNDWENSGLKLVA